MDVESNEQNRLTDKWKQRLGCVEQTDSCQSGRRGEVWPGFASSVQHTLLPSAVSSALGVYYFWFIFNFIKGHILSGEKTGIDGKA